ncbi:MAG: Na+/H+ antiporter subunit E [Planctomycetota bacterium]
MNRTVHAAGALASWLLVTWSLDWQNLVAGAAVALACGWLLGRSFPAERRGLKLRSIPGRVLWFLYYLPVFLIACFRANLDVAYRVLHINLPIRPGIVKVRTTLTTDIAKTFLANSITLTPGTLTVDIDGPDLYVHWIYIATDDPAEQTAMIVTRFETLLRKVFDP